MENPSKHKASHGWTNAFWISRILHTFKNAQQEAQFWGFSFCKLYEVLDVWVLFLFFSEQLSHVSGAQLVHGCASSCPRHSFVNCFSTHKSGYLSVIVSPRLDSPRHETQCSLSGTPLCCSHTRCRSWAPGKPGERRIEQGEWAGTATFSRDCRESELK